MSQSDEVETFRVYREIYREQKCLSGRTVTVSIFGSIITFNEDITRSHTVFPKPTKAGKIFCIAVDHTIGEISDILYCKDIVESEQQITLRLGR